MPKYALLAALDAFFLINPRRPARSIKGIEVGIDHNGRARGEGGTFKSSRGQTIATIHLPPRAVCIQTSFLDVLSDLKALVHFHAGEN